METSGGYRRGEFTFPRGCFVIAGAQELNKHQPLAVRLVGKDLRAKAGALARPLIPWRAR